MPPSRSSPPYNSVYDADPARYQALRSCWLNQRRGCFVETWLRQQPAGPVLELGSGTGMLLNRLAAAVPDREFCGLDPLDSYVRFAAEKSCVRNVAYIRGVAEEAQQCLPRNDFGVVLSNDVLHHCVDLFRVAEQVSLVSRPDAQWLLIEPNCLNLYSFCRQLFMPGESVFWPRRFLRAAGRAGWGLRKKGHLFLVPPFVGNPPEWAQGVERRIEWVPVLGGGIWMHLAKG